MGSAELLLVGGLFMAAFAVYSLVSALMATSNEKDMLSWASGAEPVKSKSPLINWSRPLVHQFTLKHSVKIKSESYRKKIQTLIMTAGLDRELNVNEFIGLQILWGIAFPVFIYVFNFALEIGMPTMMIFACVPLGLYGPLMYARREKRVRETSVRIDLPFFVDLLALSVEAGSDFISAIQRIVDSAEDSVLASELSKVLQDIKLGASRADAFKRMAARLDINEITSFVAVLVDSDSTGASIPQVLKDQSNQIRLERFVRAEKAGARASQTMLIPMLIFIMPAVFIVVFGPVIVQFFYGGN